MVKGNQLLYIGLITVMSCGQQEISSQQVKKELEKNLKEQVIEITMYNCQYLMWGTGSWQTITHKGNCNNHKAIHDTVYINTSKAK